MTEIETLMNKHIREMVPYSSARDEFSGHADIYLDANESWFGGNDGINRYPDPLCRKLRKEIEKTLGIPYQMTAVGNGSDEIIDMLIRIFCEPGKDSVMIERPTYGEYSVLASLNNVAVIDVPLQESLQLDKSGMLKAIAERKPKILFICSPNNPTGIVYSLDDIAELADCNEGITVVDEAYSDFSEDFRSAVSLIESNKRVVVMRTLSKAWGLAGARIGIMAADPEIIAVFNKAKAPYNVSRLGQDAAIGALVNIEAEKAVVEEIRRERKRLGAFLLLLSYIRWVIPSEANFILAGVDDPGRFCSYLASCGIVVRNRSSEPLLSGGVRITIGSEEENMKLEEALVGYSKMQEEGPVCR